MTNLLRSVRLFVLEKWFLSKYPTAEPGSTAWLVATELKFGGRHTGVQRNRVSPSDPRSEEQLKAGGMIGGDRMLHHGYADHYSRHTSRFVRRSAPVTVVEVGILLGGGLALWSELFPSGRIIGLDIDLQHTRGNLANLRARGAFTHAPPELYEFDQFADNIELVLAILKSNRIDIAIDDGFHSDETILKTIESLRPFLAEDFTYFIEDNDTAHVKIAEQYPEFRVTNFGQLTIVESRN